MEYMKDETTRKATADNSLLLIFINLLDRMIRALSGDRLTSDFLASSREAYYAEKEKREAKQRRLKMSERGHLWHSPVSSFSTYSTKKSPKCDVAQAQDPLTDHHIDAISPAVTSSPIVRRVLGLSPEDSDYDDDMGDDDHDLSKANAFETNIPTMFSYAICSPLPAQQTRDPASYSYSHAASSSSVTDLDEDDSSVDRGDGYGRVRGRGGTLFATRNQSSASHRITSGGSSGGEAYPNTNASAAISSFADSPRSPSIGKNTLSEQQQPRRESPLRPLIEESLQRLSLAKASLDADVQDRFLSQLSGDLASYKARMRTGEERAHSTLKSLETIVQQDRHHQQRRAEVEIEIACDAVQSMLHAFHSQPSEEGGTSIAATSGADNEEFNISILASGAKALGELGLSGVMKGEGLSLSPAVSQRASDTLRLAQEALQICEAAVARMRAFLAAYHAHEATISAGDTTKQQEHIDDRSRLLSEADSISNDVATRVLVLSAPSNADAGAIAGLTQKDVDQFSIALAALRAAVRVDEANTTVPTDPSSSLPNLSISSSSSSKASSLCLPAYVPAYVAEADADIGGSLERAISATVETQAHPFFQQTLRHILHALSEAVVSSLFDSSGMRNSESGADITAALCEQVVTAITEARNDVLHDRALTVRFILDLCREWQFSLSVAASRLPALPAVVDELVLMHATVMRAVLQGLPAQSACLFIPMLHSACRLCIPDYSSTSLPAASDIMSAEELVWVRFMGAICDSDVFGQSGACPVDAVLGWAYVARAQHALEFYTFSASSAAGTSSSADSDMDWSVAVAIRRVVGSLYEFLRFAGCSLLKAYQREFLTALQTIRVSLSKITSTAVTQSLEGKKLIALIDCAIKTKSMPSITFLDIENHVFDAMCLTSYHDTARHVFDQHLGQGNQSLQYAMLVQIRMCTGKALNQLDVTEESAALVVDSIHRLLVGAGSNAAPVLQALAESRHAVTSDPLCRVADPRGTLYRFTLDKIASLLLDRTKTVNLTIEGHTLKLARVISGLATREPAFCDVMRCAFYRACPITVPRVLEAGPDPTSSAFADDAMCRQFGYNFQAQKQEQQSESNKDWLARMSPIFGLAVELALQPDNGSSSNPSPVIFSLDDSWIWLSRFTNALTRSRDRSRYNPPEPPFFTAQALDIFLRTAAETLNSALGDRFLAVLSVLMESVLPRLKSHGDAATENAISRLREFLSAACGASGSRRFLGMFAK